MREHAAAIVVRRRVGEPPGLRADGRVEDDAGNERVPRPFAALRPKDLPDPPRRELAPRVAQRADADDVNVERVAVDLDDAPNGPLRHAPLADDAVDPRDATSVP